MRKVYVIQDSAGWMCDYYFTSYRKANECRNRMIVEDADVYDFPLFIRSFSAY